MRALMLLLVGCGGSDAGKTLVYALDGPPEALLDRNVCATGVGLNQPLNLEQGLSYAVASDGRDATLGTCTLSEAGAVEQCFTIDPPVVLSISDAGSLVGEHDIPVQVTNSDCSGATLSAVWTLELGDAGTLAGTVRSVWRLDSSPECEDFEADLISQSLNGRGMEDCVLTHTLAGTLAARCSVFNNSLDCREP